MSQVLIKGGVRTKLSKGELNRIRREGGVPAVLYGRTVPSTPLYINPESFKKISEQKSSGLVELSIEGLGKYNAMIHHVDREPLKRRILHIDFHAVDLNEKVEVEVPIHLVGSEVVEKLDGVVQQQMREVLIRALPTDVPEHISADISNMKIGDNLRVKELQLPASCEAKSEPDEIIVTVIPAKNAEPDTEVEPKEPELVHDTEGQGVGAHEANGAHE